MDWNTPNFKTDTLDAVKEGLRWEDGATSIVLLPDCPSPSDPLMETDQVLTEMAADEAFVAEMLPVFQEWWLVFEPLEDDSRSRLVLHGEAEGS